MLIGLLNAEEPHEKPFIIRVYDIKDIIPPSINEEEEQPIIEDIVKPVKDLTSLEPQPVAQKLSEILTTKTQIELENINLTVSKEGDSLIASNFKDKTSVDNSSIDKNIAKDKDQQVKDTYNSPEVDVIPACINLNNIQQSIIYPQIAVEAGIEGRVTVKVLVGTDGNVIKVVPINGPGVFYDEVKEKANGFSFFTGFTE